MRSNCITPESLLGEPILYKKGNNNMPNRAQTSNELITFEQATSIMNRLNSKGATVAKNLRENGPSGLVSTDTTINPEYYDDKAPHEFIANVWGMDTSLGIDNVVMNSGLSSFETLRNIAQMSFVGGNPSLTYNRAVDAILSLPVIKAALEEACKF